MKIMKKILYFTALNFFAFHAIDCSESNQIYQDALPENIDEKRDAHHDLDRTPKINIIRNILKEYKKNVRNEFKASESKFDILCRKERELEYTNNKRNNHIFKKIYVATICVIASATTIFESFLKSKSARIFIVDDIAAAMATKSLWTTLAPPIIFATAGICVWRQIDYMLHAEDRMCRSRMEEEWRKENTAMKKRFLDELNQRDGDLKTALASRDKEFSATKSEMKKQFAATDRANSDRDEAVYKFINSSNQLMSRNYERLQEHFTKQNKFLTSIIDKLQISHDEDTKHIEKIIEDTRLDIKNTQEELELIHDKIDEAREINSQMESKLKEMKPVLENVHKKITKLVQDQSSTAATCTQEFDQINIDYQDFDSVDLTSEDDDEDEEELNKEEVNKIGVTKKPDNSTTSPANQYSSFLSFSLFRKN